MYNQNSDLMKQEKFMLPTMIEGDFSAEELAEEAISKTLVRAGPTQGVQAKLKVNPKIRATAGFIEKRLKRNGNLCSRVKTLLPNS